MAGQVLNGTEEELVRICEKVLQRDGIRPEDDLFDLGATSLTFIRILVEVNKRFDVGLTGAELGEDASIQRLGACVATAKNPT
ncbi:acyl carrier protein [Nonomuraea sp. NPDC050643]|uniref:acyl carrier protein n=1 Tax=Nonomuraea sp. NPDC050643 TaxID=3155660 RepID=UPI0033FCCCA3